MIDPLVPSAIVKARLLENILEIINSNDEKFLDISIVCRDGSFLWSQFLLAAASDLFATAMQGIEVTQVIFPDLQVEDVRGSLLGLLYNTIKTEHGNNFPLLSCTGSFPENIFSPYQDSNDKDVRENDELIDKSPVSVDLDDDMIKVEMDSDNDNYNEPHVEIQEEKVAKNVKESPISKTKIGIGKNARKKTSKEKDPKVWIRDPSPERFVNGKKVKYICVTQDNIATGPPYNCIECSYKSNEIVNVNKHFRKHSKEKPFGCKDCGQKFSASNSVVAHWNTFHNKDWKKEFSCDICGLLFPLERLLIRHKIVHSGESFVCSVCGKGFKSPWGRDGHEARHNQEVVTCPICGKEFPNQISAKEHQERHEGRNHECELCGKTFKTKKDVQIHKKVVHTEDGSFNCTVCGKIFKLKLYLNNHMKRVHEKSTRFQCLLCPQVLSTKNKFKRHSLRRHNGQMIPVSNRVQ